MCNGKWKLCALKNSEIFRQINLNGRQSLHGCVWFIETLQRHCKDPRALLTDFRHSIRIFPIHPVQYLCNTFVCIDFSKHKVHFPHIAYYIRMWRKSSRCPQSCAHIHGSMLSLSHHEWLRRQFSKPWHVVRSTTAISSTIHGYNGLAVQQTRKTNRKTTFLLRTASAHIMHAFEFAKCAHWAILLTLKIYHIPWVHLVG